MELDLSGFTTILFSEKNLFALLIEFLLVLQTSLQMMIICYCMQNHILELA